MINTINQAFESLIDDKAHNIDDRSDWKRTWWSRHTCSNKHDEPPRRTNAHVPEHQATEADNPIDMRNKTEGCGSTLIAAHHSGANFRGATTTFMYWDTIQTRNPSSTTDGEVALRTMTLKGSPGDTLLNTANEAKTTSTT